MIGKIIGAFVGDRLAKRAGGLSGAQGAALGVVGTAVLRRISLPAMAAIAAGGYAAKKLSEKNAAGKSGAADSSR